MANASVQIANSDFTLINHLLKIILLISSPLCVFFFFFLTYVISLKCDGWEIAIQGGILGCVVHFCISGLSETQLKSWLHIAGWHGRTQGGWNQVLVLAKQWGESMFCLLHRECSSQNSVGKVMQKGNDFWMYFAGDNLASNNCYCELEKFLWFCLYLV